MSARQSSGGRRRWLRFAAAGSVLLVLGAYLVTRLSSEVESPYRCVVQGGEKQEPYELEPQMIRNAATIEVVGTVGHGLPERAVTIALATAMQESMLRNIDYGDRDSVGLFQQRPSQGWGTVEQIMDPVYSAGKFYERLVEVPGYTELPLTEAAQKVQLSAFPDEYAKHEPRAGQLAAALTGRRAAAVNCSGKLSGEPVVGDADRARKKLVAEFGGDIVPGTDSGPPGADAQKESLTIPVGTDGGRTAEERGWQLAHWAIANASHLGVERITYGERLWDAESASDGWQESEPAESAGVTLSFTR